MILDSEVHQRNTDVMEGTEDECRSWIERLIHGTGGDNELTGVEGQRKVLASGSLRGDSGARIGVCPSQAACDDHSHGERRDSGIHGA